MAESLTLVAAEAAGNFYSQLQAQLGAGTANVAMMVLTITIYALVIGTFWKTFSRRNIFEIDWKKVGKGFVPQVLERVKFGLEYVIVFPLAVFVWFVVLTIFLYFISKTASIADMMFISISLVAATRICSYLDEDIAVDVAKTVPIALFAVFLASPTTFSPLIIEQRLAEMAELIGDALPFFLMLMGLEVVLRILFLAKRIVAPEKE
ncbi:MAG: hypothetical protein AB1657_02480 [Candidatus Micrarchaeota archaeon]